MRSCPTAAAVLLVTLMIGVGVLHFLSRAGASLERVRAATCDGHPGGDAAPGPDQAPSVPAAAGGGEVVVKSNDPCYVCHMPFLQESLAVAHARAKVWCGTCHGPSIRHIEDENIGATPPDVVYGKPAIDRMCGQCHDPKKHAELTGKTRLARLAEGTKAQEEIKRRKIKVTGVCTDCHGRHWIPSRGQESPPQGSNGNPGAGSTVCPREEATRRSRSNGARGICLGRCSSHIGRRANRRRLSDSLRRLLVPRNVRRPPVLREGALPQ